MKIVSIGGGPAGLYFAILMKQVSSSHEIEIYERNGPDDTFGWGVVFSDETLGHFADADRSSYQTITDSFAYWKDIDVYVRDTRIRSTGHGFAALSRRKLLNIMQRRCVELGVKLHFESEIEDVERFRDADLVLAADGANSLVRKRYEQHFEPSIDWRRCKFTWLGTDLRYDAFTFIFRENEHGLFQVHAYPFDACTSTFIVECREEVWKRAGLDAADEDQTVRYLEKLFAADLKGHQLLTNRSLWRTFPTIRNASWQHENVVLTGDAAHTAHFSIGSGTKLAMEDAISLASHLRNWTGSLEGAVSEYESARRNEVARVQRAAQTSLEWFENSARYVKLAPLQLAFSLMTRSKRITYDNLRARDTCLVDRVTRWFAAENPYRDAAVARPAVAADVPATEGSPAPVTTPLFQPFRLREMTLANRVVVSPMCQYSSTDGTPTDWHLVHLGGRALGGAGLVFTEATHVSREGRISLGCAGIYKDEHVEAWRRVVAFVHANSKARIGMQIAHSGRKGSCTLPWEGDRPLESGGWEVLAPSPIAFDDGWPVPREATRGDMDRVKEEFVRAARYADEAGFDLLELHFAHGYLLGTFISPLTNRRRDEYGGSLGNRMRYPLEVFDAVRGAWPDEKPMSVRISATDWKDGGVTREDRLGLARLLKRHGCDIVDVSGGQTVPDQEPIYGRMFQVPFSEEIRMEAGVPTMTVGNIQSADQCQTIVAAGRADLCVLARAHLRDPYFTLHAAEDYEHHTQYWPPQYLAARPRPR